jgi:hypothetical protein
MLSSGSKKSFFTETHEAAVADYDMVEKIYFQKLPGLADALSEEYILMAGRRITARMVVYDNDADCPRPEGGEKEITDRDDGPVHSPFGKMLFSYQPVPAV